MAVVAVVLVPILYPGAARGLPTRGSELDLERLLKLSIDNERKGAQLGKDEKTLEAIAVDRPDFAKLPKNLVAFYITERGCPSYLQTPREEGFAWNKRGLLGVVGIYPEDTDGWCEN